jgi:hypothetical protein
MRIELERESAAIKSPEVKQLCVAVRRRIEADVPQSLDLPETVPIIPLPFLHQHELSSDLGARICSPVSVAMVLRGRGVDVAPLELAESTYHRGHDLYGIWPLAIHAAYQLGIGAWAEYFEDWSKPVSYLKRGTPLVLSIAFEEGDLKRPPYKRTGGHLLVLLGVDEAGHPITHDPNLPAERGAFLKWEAGDLARAWFGHGGVAYVFPSRMRRLVKS